MRYYPSALLLLCLACASACSSYPPGTICSKNVVVTGYWPPTNEMVRQFSINPQRNPSGWLGRNWRGLGFDVYAFFPEFPPDGDPTNDAIGDPGSVGAPAADFRVDYRDTSSDFWRIMDTYRPIVLITTSRGGDIAWELEAVEGGHGQVDQSPEQDWISDREGDEYPSRSTIDVRSWEAISAYRAGKQLSSQLPLEEIQQSVRTIIDSKIDHTGTSGNYLSGFMGLHGLYYNATHAHNQMAGHIHVGKSVSNAKATRAFEATLGLVLSRVTPTDCTQ